MRWTFDVNANALYVYLVEGAPTRQVELGGGVIVDVDDADTVVGVEVLSPGANFPRDELLDLGLDARTVDTIGYLIHTPLPQTAPGGVMASLARGDQEISQSTMDLQAEPVPA